MMSPGTEQSIQRIAALMPQLIKELGRHNDNMDLLKSQREGGGTEIGELIEELKKFRLKQSSG